MCKVGNMLEKEFGIPISKMEPVPDSNELSRMLKAHREERRLSTKCELFRTIVVDSQALGINDGVVATCYRLVFDETSSAFEWQEYSFYEDDVAPEGKIPESWWENISRVPEHLPERFCWIREDNGPFKTVCMWSKSKVFAAVIETQDKIVGDDELYEIIASDRVEWKEIDSA